MSHNASATAASPGEVPARVQVEQTLEQLLQTLIEMGICASDVQESALEGAAGGVASAQPGGLLGRKVQQTVDQLARLYAQKDSVADINIPIEVINLVDQGKNPHLHTKNFTERLAGENMYTNGILSGISDYRDLLRSQLGDAFPDLAEDVKLMTATQGESQAGLANGVVPPQDVKMEEAR
ncbi:hypothetical protein JCM8202_003255 [Rhodotorula sphaerocarpa]